MGEMCDFEAEFYPENWHFPWRKSGKTKTRKSVTISMSEKEYAAYKAIGGAVGARKLFIERASVLTTPTLMAAIKGERE